MSNQIKKKFGHNVSDLCQGCGMEFGDHRAKPPHVSMPPDPPCRGFRPVLSEGKADPRYAIS